MTTFLQLHVLTSYPPANLNRDDTGRPKTAIVGGRQRLRISSQALKRAWRTSDAFMEIVEKDERGVRTKRFGRELMTLAEDRIAKEAFRKKVVKAVVSAFGKAEGETDNTTLVFLSNAEREAAKALIESSAQSGKEPEEASLKNLVMERPRAADIAMFGRMLADTPRGNVEAAVQVAHAFTVHDAVVEDDYFTAVDDLKDRTEGDDAGAGHLGETGFGAGVFYTYVCVNTELLTKNLGDDDEARALASRAMEGLVRAMTTVGPSGKQASFGSRARASYCLAEVGNGQPRSLAVAFLSPVDKRDVLRGAVASLRQTRVEFTTLYGEETEAYELAAAHANPDDKPNTAGSLDALVAFATRPFRGGHKT